MKVRAQQPQLSAALAAAIRPDKSHLLASVVDDRLVFVGDDGVTMVTAGLDISIEGDPVDVGLRRVPAKLFADGAKGFGDGPVRIVMDGDRWSLTAGSSCLRIPATRAQPLAVAALRDVGIVETADLRLAINRVVPAAGTNETVPVLTGVYIERVSGHLRFVATDKFRVHLADTRMPDRVLGASALVPASSLALAERLLPAEGPVMIRTGDHDIEFNNQTLSIRSRLIVGEFPDYRRAIRNTTAETTTIAEARELRGVIERAARVLTAEPVYLTFRPDADLIDIEARSAKNSMSFTSSFVAKVTGSELTIAADPRHIMDALDATVGSETVMEMSGEFGPIEFRTVDAARALVAIVMPNRK